MIRKKRKGCDYIYNKTNSTNIGDRLCLCKFFFNMFALPFFTDMIEFAEAWGSEVDEIYENLATLFIHILDIQACRRSFEPKP